MCFFVTKSVTLTCCAPLILVGARYYYSRKVIQSYLDCALHTDMADIETYYMTPTGKTRTGRSFILSAGTMLPLLNIEKFYRELIKYRSSLFFPPLLPLLPFSPPSPTQFLSEPSSVMGRAGVGMEGGRSGDGAY